MGVEGGEEVAAGQSADSPESAGFLASLLEELQSPANVLLICACLYIVYKLWVRQCEERAPPPPAEPQLPPLKRQDFTLEQLKVYDGTDKCDGRVLVAVNYKVFDVTRGKRFYGPGGPYAAFSGKDASRGLATFSVEGVDDHFDDLSDLTPMQMESVREWEAQFTDRYVYIGKLLKPGEKATDYSEDEEAAATTEAARPSAPAGHKKTD